MALPGARNTETVQDKGHQKVPSALHSAQMEGSRPFVPEGETGQGEEPLGDQSLL